MSKRFGNITTARDLREDGVDAGGGAAAHVPDPLPAEARPDGRGARQRRRKASRRLGEFQRPPARSAREQVDGYAVESAAAGRSSRELAEALDDDLNAPRAVAALFAFVTARRTPLWTPERSRARAPWPRGTGRTRFSAWPARSGRSGCDVAARRQAWPRGAVRIPARGRGGAEGGPRAWAVRRKEAKVRAELRRGGPDPELLEAAGCEVRDSKDGSMRSSGSAGPAD